MSGRVDLYHAFLKALSFVLKENGIAGIIVSNRFMYIRSGETTREDILTNFEIKGIWDFGDTKLFEAAVLPAVLILKKKNNPQNNSVDFASIYTLNNNKDIIPTYNSIFDTLTSKGKKKLKDNTTYLVKKGRLEFGNLKKNVWRISESKSEKWLESVHHNSYYTFGEIGIVRVGVKTTADKIFIRDDWDELKDEKPEDDLLKPLINHKFADQYIPKPNGSPTKILYPYTSNNGKRAIIDLEKYPKTMQYFLKHKEQLSNRKYVVESGREWFEIWVPQQPSDWKLPKLIFWDITESPTFWLDLTGAIVNGDCYWFKLIEQNFELLLLCLAVGNSKFIEQYYDVNFMNKLYAGRRRFQAQYVKNFPIPKPDNEHSRQIISNTKTMLTTLDATTLNMLKNENSELVFKAFDIESLE